MGAVANALLKAGITVWLGSPQIRRPAGGVLLATALVGVGVILTL
jgi:hypothetical protein